MPAHVEKRPDSPLGVTDENHRVLTHIGVEKVVGVGNQAFMANHEPSTAKNLFQFCLVDIGVCKDITIQLTGVEVDNLVFVGARHRQYSPPLGNADAHARAHCRQDMPLTPMSQVMHAVDKPRSPSTVEPRC